MVTTSSFWRDQGLITCYNYGANARNQPGSAARHLNRSESPEYYRSTMLPDEQDVEGFVDSVSDVQRLIAGLKAGTISPEYVDSKIQAATARTEAQSKAGPRAGRAQQQQQHGAPAGAQQPPAAPDAPEKEAARHAELQKKVEELKASRQRKLRARQLYEQHASQAERHQLFATDYTQWDLWCPSDDEDDLFNSCTPNNPQFRAMEKDITDRHNRMVEQRQIAERQRQLGNTAFKAGQFSEALRCYQSGLESQRHNMALHANAAMAALKLKCYVQALEHCDKVLHLAEVLYNKPKHELCIKALQRRAAAYQGLQQHSKAVADLEAAAAMLPDDGEIGQQLRAAKALLDEHKTAKALRQLVAGAAGHQAPEAPKQLPECPSSASSSSSSSPPDLISLQRIERLTAALNAAATPAAAAASPAQSVAACCGRLQGLILQPPSHSTYFRECGGLDALAKLVPKLREAADLAAALQLLAAACDNQTTLQCLCSQHVPLLAAVLDSITPEEAAAGCAAADRAAAVVAAASAVDLAHTASMGPQMRQAVCQQLLLRPAGPHHHQQQQQASHEERQRSSPCRLDRLWLLACGPQPHQEVAPGMMQLQVAAVSLLSNCLLVPAVRDAAAAMLSRRPTAVEDLAQLLQEGDSGSSPGSSRSRAAALLREKLYGLVSNASSHPGMRKQLAQHEPLVQRLIAAALPGRGQQGGAACDSSGCAAAAIGCLCNLSLEACVQQQLAEQDTTAALLQLTLCGSSLLPSCSPTTTATGAGLGDARLPTRGLGGRQQQAAAAAEDAEALMLRQQRAALLLSRAAKSAAGLQLLQAQGALGNLLQALACHLQQQQQEKQRQSDGEGQDASWVEAVMRTVALMTAAPGACASCGAAEASAAIDACLELLRAPAAAAPAAVKGNAALCLGHFGAECQWHAALHRADAVGALLAVAAGGRGDAASRNAGIAVAKMARDERMMARLRELRGLEVIYAYAKP